MVDDEKKLGITVKKEENFSEWYTQVCSEQGAKLADVRYGVQGFVVHRPWAFKILRKIYESLEKEVEADEHEPFLFPLVIKEENLQKEKEHAGFTPDVFWVTEAGDKKMEERVALRPTGETQIYPMYSLWLRSYKDLPFKGYQSRIMVYRNEKTTRPFIRGREFMFFETHDVFLTHGEVIEQVRKDLEIAKKVIYDQLKIPFIFFKRPFWDKFKGADATYTPDTLMPDGKRNQLASTHDLGQNFSKAFDIKVKDKSGNDVYVWQTCFGPGIWRIMAALIAIHGDNNGLVLPFSFAPIQVIIVPIIFNEKKSESEKILKRCKEVKEILSGFEVKIDDSNNSPGFKFNQWEMFGVPIRIEIGPKEVKNKEITLVKRTDKKRMKIKINDLNKQIAKQASLLDSEIKLRADKYFINNTKNAKDLNELKEIIAVHRGFVRAPFCSVDIDGQKCAEIMKEETNGAYVCGTKFPKEEKVDSKTCIVCKKRAKHIVYIAKSY